MCIIHLRLVLSLVGFVCLSFCSFDAPMSTSPSVASPVNISSAEPSSTPTVSTSSVTVFSSTPKNWPTSSSRVESVTWSEHEKEEVKSNNSGVKPDEVKVAQREAELARVQWIIVGVVITVGLMVLGVLVVSVWLKWRRKKKGKKAEDLDQSSKTGPEEESEVNKDKPKENRSPGENPTKPSPKVNTSDSKSNTNPTPPEHEAKNDLKVAEGETNVEISITKPRDSNVQFIPNTLTKRKSIPEYWKADSKKSLEAVKSSTFAVDDAAFGFTDGSSGGLKLLKADMEEGKVFMETKEMVAQMAEAKAALGRRRPHVEMTQSSRTKTIAATLRNSSILC